MPEWTTEAPRVAGEYEWRGDGPGSVTRRVRVIAVGHEGAHPVGVVIGLEKHGRFSIVDGFWRGPLPAGEGA